MSPSRLENGRSVAALTLALLTAWATLSSAAPPARSPGAGAGVVLAYPADEERVAAPAARFQANVPGSVRDAYLVVSYQRFDPSTWSSLPEGSQWTMAPYHGGALAFSSLGLSVRNETVVWWAVVGHDQRTGSLVASKAGHFTLLPRFANRVAPDATAHPSARGSITTPPALGHTPIQLTAGYTFTPGGARPALPPDLARAVPTELTSSSGGRRGYLVQFVGLPAGDAGRRIEQAGGTLVSALDGQTYLARFDAASAARLAADPSAPWMGEWEPAYKLSPRVDRASAAPLEMHALLFSDGDAEGAKSALGAIGATNLRVSKNSVNQIVRFTLPGSAVARAAALTDVEWIEPVERDSITNDKDEWVLQTGVNGSRRIWDMGIRGQGQVLMTADSGVRTNHEMFADAAGDITDFGDYPNHRKIIAYKRGSDSPVIAFGDDAGSDYHGTHTAGTAVGNSDPTSTGQYDGIAKDAKLYFMDMAGPGSNGTLNPPDDLNDLFLPSYVGNAGGAARISSNSWGAFAQGAYTLAAMQVDQFMWNHPDYLVDVANGNDGIIGSVRTPATAKDCLSVGSTGNGDLMNTYSSFTSRGPCADLRRKPTVCAPGDGVTSSIGNTRYSYASYSGTSMATPGASGACALVREYLTEGWYPTGAPVASNAFTPSAALLKAMVMNSGVGDIPGFYLPDNNIGWGRINLDNVLYFPGDSLHTWLVDEKQGLTDQDYVEYQIQVTDPTRPLEVSLVWTDAPGNPAAARAIVNDLDLKVTHGATTYLGNYMFNGVSLTGANAKRDSINVEEGVRVTSPGVGLWTVRIEGHSVPVGPQPFAVVVTGGVGQEAGSIALDRFDYALADTVGIEVLDANATSPLTVNATSPTDPWGETVTLTGSNGVFHGTLAIAPSIPNPGDHVLSVSSGDQITVTYTDDSPAATVSAHATVNARAPVITNVASMPLGGTSALVTWTTDQPASSRVRFGPTTALGSVADSSGLVTTHSVLLTHLLPGTTYRYDAESANLLGSVTTDSLGGAHRTFTTHSKGQIALVMASSSSGLLSTWQNAFQALSWNVDVLTGADADPPVVGNATAGLASYAAVIWQTDPDAYPALSDAQRTVVDSLLNGGGRLLIMGHDLGYSLSDASAPSYTTEREAWLESGLKTRYYGDVYGPNFHFYGQPGDPVSNDFVPGVSYQEIREYATSDNVRPAPNTNGFGVVNWIDDQTPLDSTGIRWESYTPQGTAGGAFWGGQKTRLLAQYFEWAGLGGSGAANVPARTAVLEHSVDWLLGHKPPVASITSPTPGQVVTDGFVPVLYTMTPDSGLAIASRSVYASFDGGATWSLVNTQAGSDPGFIWDLGGVLGGAPVPNSQHVLLKLVTTDNGAPVLQGQTIMSGEFTLARSGGDTRGPVAVAGSAHVTPEPVRADSSATLLASFSDASLGDSPVTAAEYSTGASPAAAGHGTAMTIGTPAVTADASVALAAGTFSVGQSTLWLRGKDQAGNWGSATALNVTVNSAGVVAIGDAPHVDFLAAPSPNPFRGSVLLRFGLARSGAVQIGLYDLRGRLVRTLTSGVLDPGVHTARLDGGNEKLAAGVYFLRMTTPTSTFHAKVVALE
jgi:hypothetical protein